MFAILTFIFKKKRIKYSIYDRMLMNDYLANLTVSSARFFNKKCKNDFKIYYLF